MRAIIGRSRLEAALEYKPYIRPKVTVHKWSLEMGLKSIQATAYSQVSIKRAGYIKRAGWIIFEK